MTRFTRKFGLVALAATLLTGGLAATANTASADEDCDHGGYGNTGYAPRGVEHGWGWGWGRRWREHEWREQMRRDAWRRQAYYPAPAYAPPLPPRSAYVPQGRYPYPYNGYYR